MSLNQEKFLFNQCFTCNLHYAFGALTYCYGSGFWGTLHLPWRLTKSYKCDYFTSFTQRPAPLVGHQVQQLERFWPGNFNSASQFTNLVSYHRNSSQIFLPWCVHITFSKQIVWAIKKAQIFKYLLWYFAKLTGFFKIQYFKGHTPDWVLPKSLNADNSGQLYWLWQKKLKPGRQVSQCLMKSMICKRSETIMKIL